MESIPENAESQFTSPKSQQAIQSPKSQQLTEKFQQATHIVETQLQVASTLNSAVSEKRNELYKTMGSYQKLITILSQKTKTISEAKYIQEYVQQFEVMKAFFQDMCDDPQVVLHLCKNMEYQTFPERSVIMKQGDPSDNKMYLIIKGKVGIVIKQNKNVFEGENQAQEDVEIKRISQDIENLRKKRRKSSLVANLSKNSLSRKSSKFGSMLENLIFQNQDQSLEETIKSYGSKVNDLNVGQYFGQLALINPKQPRNATIVCLEQVDCIIIYKKDFDKVQSCFNKEAQAKEALITKLIPFMSHINSPTLKEQLLNYFKLEPISKGQMLTQENHIGEKIYLLQTGKLKVEQQFRNFKNIYYNDYHQIKICNLDQPCFFGEEILFQKEELDIQKIIDLEELDFLEEQNEQLINKYVKNAVQQAQQMKYLYTISVETLLTRVYAITKTDLKKNFPIEVNDYIRDQFINKEKSRKQTFQKNNLMNNQESFYTKVDDISHQFNYLRNNEIFCRMRSHDLIDNFNKKNLILKQQNFQDILDCDQQLNPKEKETNIHGENEFIQSNIKRMIQNELDDRQIKKTILFQKFLELKKESKLDYYQNYDENQPIDKNEIIETLYQNLRYNKISIDDVSYTDLLGTNQQDEIQKFKQVKSNFFEEQEKKNSDITNNHMQKILKEKKLLEEKNILVNQEGQFVSKEHVIDLGWQDAIQKKQYFKLLTMGLIKPKTQHPPIYSDIQKTSTYGHKLEKKMKNRRKFETLLTQKINNPDEDQNDQQQDSIKPQSLQTYQSSDMVKNICYKTQSSSPIFQIQSKQAVYNINSPLVSQNNSLIKSQTLQSYVRRLEMILNKISSTYI